MSRHLAAAAAFALLVLLSGCTMGGVPQKCSGLPQDRLASCIYIQAVLDQDPFYCYRLDSIDDRKVCIRDSSDSLAKKRLEAMTDAEREGALRGIKPAPEAAPPYQPAEPEQPTTEVGAIVVPPTEPQEVSVQELDAELYSTAVQANDVQLCEQIYDPEVLKSCISQVARQKKNLSICETLSTQDYIEICRMYSQGEIKQ